VDGVDAEDYPDAMVVKDTLDASPSVCPAVDMLACTDGGSGCAVFAYADGGSSYVVPSGAGGGSSSAVSVCDVMAAPSCATSVMGTADVAVSVHDIMAAPGCATSASGTPDMPPLSTAVWTPPLVELP
jgi:galactokinase/mevalonate kinase-like predicted kinase